MSPLGMLAPALALLTQAGPATQRPAITGSVTDSATGAPLPGVRVERGEAWAITAADGRFVLLRPAPGAHDVLARRAGHRPTLVPAVPAGATNLHITLVPLPVMLDPLVVSVARVEQAPFDAPASVSVVPGDDARAAVALTGADHLRHVAGVDMAAKGMLASTYAMRGFLGASSDALLVLTDYRPSAVPSLRFNIPYLVPGTSDDIERIEVQRGPGAALFGPGADRGVVHVITRSPFDSPGATMSVSGGSRELLDVSGRFSRAWRRIGFKVSGSWFRGRDFTFADTTRATMAPEANSERATGDVRLDWRLSDRTEAVFALGLASAVRVTDLTPAGPYQLRDWRNGYVQARLQRGATFLNVALNATDAGGSYSLATGARVRDESRQLTAQAQRQLLSGRRSLVAGADARWTDPRTFGTINGAFEDDDAVREVGAFATFTQALSRSADLTGALRADHHSALDGLAVSPRIGLVIKPAPDHALRLTYNRAFVAPSATTLFADFRERPLGGPWFTRVTGIPRGGFTFRDDCGGPCMRSPFDPAGPQEFVSADAPGAWDGLVALLNSQGIDISGIPRPTAAQVGSALVLGGTPVTGVPAAIRANERELTDVLELGYKGLIGSRTFITADVYHTRVSNVIQTLAPVTPVLLLDSASLAGYLASYTGAAEAIADAVQEVPFGTVSPVEATHPTDVLLASRQGGSYGLWGVDFTVESQLTRTLTANASWSWTSRDSVPAIALGVPRQKMSAALAWRSGDTRLELRGRALRSYPVASGVYSGRIAAYGVVDLTAGTTLGRLRFTLSANNVLDRRHREFPSGPMIGRLVVARIGASF